MSIYLGGQSAARLHPFAAQIAALCPPDDRGVEHDGKCPVCDGHLKYGRTADGKLRAVCCTTAPCFVVTE